MKSLIKNLVLVGLYSSGVYAEGINSQQFFDQLDEAINDSIKKEKIVNILNQYGEEHRMQARIAIEKEFDQLRPLLPMTYDRYTELQSVQVFMDAIRYNLFLSEEYIEKYDMDEFKRNIKSLTINQVCSNPRLFFLVILDFRIIQFYYAPDHKIIKEIVITEKDCA